MTGRALDRFAELSSEERQVLTERARSLAQSGRTTEGSTESLGVLQIASRGQVYAVPMDVVEGISEVHSVAFVPRSPAFVKGLVSFRGEVLIAIELSVLVGGATSGFADLRRIVCLAAGKRKLAVLAESAMSVQAVDPARFISDPSMRSPFIVGTDSKFVSLLEPSGLMDFAFDALAAAQ